MSVTSDKSTDEQLVALEQLLLTTNNLHNEFITIEREARRLQIEAQELLDKRHLLTALHRISTI